MTTKDINVDRACEHLNFNSIVDVARITPIEGGPIGGFAAEVKVWCRDCDEPFRFIGVDFGLNPRGPRVSIDETELRAPIRPASSDPDFGLGLAGFDIKLIESDLRADGDGSFNDGSDKGPS